MQELPAMFAVPKLSSWRIWSCAWWLSSGKTLWTRLGTDHDQVKILFAVIAALFILWEYHDKQVENRISKTYDFQTRLGSDELQKARLDLNILLIHNKPAIKAAGTSANDLIADLVRKAQLERNALLLVDFYTEAATCAKLNLCELDVACEAFRAPVDAFRNNFYSLFEQWKKDWGDDFISEPYEYFTSNCSSKRTWCSELLGWASKGLASVRHIFG
jgi:hypothetical protein